jgi:histidinol phosphatase-like PHP family hydrolase
MRPDRPASQWLVRASALLREWPAIDFQMHTRWSDGASSVPEMIAAAQAKGLQAIAITEHVNDSSVWYPDFVAEVKAARAAVRGCSVYFGAEIAAADYHGRLKADPTAIETELLVGVVHRLPRSDGFWNFDQLSRDDAIDLELRALLGLTRNRHIDVLGHPGATTARKYGRFPVEWLEPVFAAAAEREVAIELNSKYLWDSAATLALLTRTDPLVSLGSDAHDASEVGRPFRGLPMLPEEGVAA